MTTGTTKALRRRNGTGPAVVHSTSAWLPLTQTWLYHQVQGLAAAGMRAYVVCDRVEELDRFRVPGLYFPHQLPRLASRLASYGRSAQGKPPASRRLRNVALRVQADILHSHFGNRGWRDLAAALALKRARPGVRHIVTFYGYDVQRLPTEKPVWYGRYRELFASVDLVLCEGRHMARSIAALGCDPGKVAVHHIGVPVEEIDFRPKTLAPGEPVRVLIAAAFREKKGIPYAIAALGALAGDYEFELTLIGDASRDPASHVEKRRILDALKQAGLGGRTRILGWRTHREIFTEAARHHLFLHPSVTSADGDAEGGSPVVLTEMMAAGLIVVATRHCDIPEVTTPFAETLLAPERDVPALAACIRWAIDNARHWPELAATGRKWIEREYDLSTQTRELLRHYGAAASGIDTGGAREGAGR